MKLKVHSMGRAQQRNHWYMREELQAAKAWGHIAQVEAAERASTRGATVSSASSRSAHPPPWPCWLRGETAARPGWPAAATGDPPWTGSGGVVSTPDGTARQWRSNRAIG